MLLKQPQKLSEQLHFIGSSQYSTYLLMGERSALFDGGIMSHGPTIYKQLKSILGEQLQVDYLVISHAHYDSVGMIPYLKRMLPGLKVMGGPDTQETLTDDRAVKTIRTLNEDSLRTSRNQRLFLHYDASFDKDLAIDSLVQHGDILDLGRGLQVHIVSVPGHSREVLALYLERQGTLITADNLGIMNTPDNVFPLFFSDYEQYHESMQRLRELAPRRLLMTLFGGLLDTDIPRFFTAASTGAEEFFDFLAQRIRRDVPHERIYAEAQEVYYKLHVAQISRVTFLMYVRSMLELVEQTIQVAYE